MSPRLSSWLALPSAFFLANALLLAKTTLTVAAAADLAVLAPELKTSFERANPSIDVHFVFEASAALAQQVENGAPYDVFLSANAQFIDRLVASGKMASQTVVYATGRIAVLWRDRKHHNLQGLTQNWIHFIALANPQLAPYGAAARDALEHAQLWERVKSKVVYGENVRQTLQLFDSGNADAVLTAAGLVANREPQLIPADWHKPIVQKAGIVSGTLKHNEAALFLRFLTDPAGQAAFARHGFGKPTL